MRYNFYFDPAIVPVKMLALAIVIDETMPITKMDFFGYLVNDEASSSIEVSVTLFQGSDSLWSLYPGFRCASPMATRRHPFQGFAVRNT